MNKLLAVLVAAAFALGSAFAFAKDIDPKAASATHADYQGLWMAVQAVSGAGGCVQIINQGRTVTEQYFSAAWITRNATEHPPWSGSVKAAQIGSNAAFIGRKYDVVNGPVRSSIAGPSYPVIRRRWELLGTARFDFTDDNEGTLDYQGITYQLSRLSGTDCP